MICWGLPVIVTFLPLTTNTFGENDDQNPWCFIASRPGSPSYGVVLWEILAFYIWVWVSLIVNILLIISISLQLKRMAVVSEDITQTIRKLSLYPLILIFCWVGATFFDMYGLDHYVSNFDDVTFNANITVTVANTNGSSLFEFSDRVYASSESYSVNNNDHESGSVDNPINYNSRV
eukprot:gene27469-34189_t